MTDLKSFKKTGSTGPTSHTGPMGPTGVTKEDERLTRNSLGVTDSANQITVRAPL